MRYNLFQQCYCGTQSWRAEAAEGCYLGGMCDTTALFTPRSLRTRVLCAIIVINQQHHFLLSPHIFFQHMHLSSRIHYNSLSFKILSHRDIIRFVIYVFKIYLKILTEKWEFMFFVKKSTMNRFFRSSFCLLWFSFFSWSAFEVPFFKASTALRIAKWSGLMWNERTRGAHPPFCVTNNPSQ